MGHKPASWRRGDEKLSTLNSVETSALKVYFEKRYDLEKELAGHARSIQLCIKKLDRLASERIQGLQARNPEMDAALLAKSEVHVAHGAQWFDLNDLRDALDGRDSTKSAKIMIDNVLSHGLGIEDIADALDIEDLETLKRQRRDNPPNHD